VLWHFRHTAPAGTARARLARPADTAHSGRVLTLLLRRVVVLAAILAFLAGIQMRLMPAAVASPAPSMAGMTSDVAGDLCKGCASGKMTVADCGALCATIVAVIDVMPTSLLRVAPPAWAWSNELARPHAVAPDTAPPRS
jgi:hypothetical protein